MKNILFFVMVLGLASCAYNVKSPTDDAKSPYAPQNESGQGVVKYPSSTLGNRSSREAALKKAFEACNGKYIIDEERVAPVGWHVTDEYTYIYYRCVK